MRYAIANRRISSLLLICEATSKPTINSMAFAFALIGTETDSFVAFAFTFVFAFAPMEEPQYVYMLFPSFLLF